MKSDSSTKAQIAVAHCYTVKLYNRSRRSPRLLFKQVISALG